MNDNKSGERIVKGITQNCQVIWINFFQENYESV